MRPTGILIAILSASVMGSLFTGCSNRNLVESSATFGEGVVRLGDTPVAEVSGTRIWLSDVERAAAAQDLIELGAPLSPSDPAFNSVLEELIDQRLLALDALGQALDQEDDVRRRLSSGREKILGNVRVERHLRDSVNETTIRRMYEEQTKIAKRGDEVRARHILVETKDEADALFAELEDGADFAELAEEHSLDTGTRIRGGDLDWFAKDALDPAFTQVAFASKKGDRPPPVQTSYGWHVMEVLGRRTPDLPGFEEMRPQIVNFMTYDAIQTLIQDLRAEREVTLLTGQAGKVSTADEGEEVSGTETPETQLDNAQTTNEEAP